MHGPDGPRHDASQGQVSAARRFGKPAEDVEDVRLRSGLYSATSRPALLTHPRPPRRAPWGRDRQLVGGASAIGRDRLTTEERLSDIVEILAHGLLWLDVLRDYHRSIRSHNFRRFVTEGGLISLGIDQAALYRLAPSFVATASLKAGNQPTSRCRLRRNTKPCSTSRLPKHSAWKYRRVCLPVPTR